MSAIFTGPDGLRRCGWCAATPLFLPYHDEEWGFPVADDRRLFEKLCLEGFQSGLSWRTILAKREGFRTAFLNFDFERLADFTGADVERLVQNPDIVRHRGKITSVINNARRARALVAEAGSLSAFVWAYAPQHPAKPQSASISAESIALSRALKKRGCTFVGPTTVYAFMQAMGLINDHAEDCAFREKAAQTQAERR